MEYVDRMALLVRPKQPYIEWANSFDGGGPQYESTQHSAKIYLIDEVTDPSDVKKVVRRYWRDIFEEELNAWMRTPEVWPNRRTLGVFLQWFDVKVCDMVTDLGSLPIQYE